MVKRAVNAVVKGTVQGVFFRNFCKENADKLRLKGFVRNLTDGNVEVVLEGDNAAIDKMLGVLKKGPAHSQIKKVDVEEKKWAGDFDSFKILRF